MKIFGLGLLVPILFLTVGCSTHVASVKYQQEVSLVAGVVDIPPVAVGSFSDRRGTDSRWLGAIRGGYGNVLKKILTDEPTTSVVQNAFVAALAARNVRTTATDAQLVIEGAIIKLDCSYFFNREAHAHLQVNVVSLPSRAIVYSQIYKTDNTEPGVGAGIFGDPVHLALFEQKTLNQTINKTFADPAFVSALRSQGPVPGATASTPAVSERLRALDQLRKEDLISEEEYSAKRKELLGNI